MQRYTIRQRIQVIQAYYANGHSNINAYHVLRDFFGQFNRPNVRTIGNIVQKFDQTGYVADVKTTVHAPTTRSAENLAAVRASVAVDPSTSTRRRAQQLHLSRSSLINIIHKDLHLDANRNMTTTAMEAGNFKLTEIEGDLFGAPTTHSLAHCVGADLAMGAGIAVKFKQIFGKVNELKAQGAQSGGVAVIEDNERYIYYLVTKGESWGRPTYDSLRSSLIAMREHMRKNNVHNLAIPRIGCGIDGLEWDKVSTELKNVFGSEDLEIVVYNFVPK